MVPTLSQLNGLGSIQFLNLNTTAFAFWDVIALIKILPMMSDLTVKSTSPGPLPYGITLDKLPAYVLSTYAPMGERFRFWRFNSPTTAPFTINAQCVLLLALVCPNFTFAAPPYGERKEYAAQLKTEMASDMFKPYEPRFK
ncbi:hypothetical protein GGI19_005195, partial [Coemansia pectinata]